MAGPRYDEAQVRDALTKGGNVTNAARLLGVSRKTVHDYIRRYGIPFGEPVRTVQDAA